MRHALILIHNNDDELNTSIDKSSFGTIKTGDIHLDPCFKKNRASKR